MATPMTTRDRVQYLDTSALLAAQLRSKVALIAAHLSAERAILDGMAGGSDAPSVSGGDISDPTLGAAEARLDLDRHELDIDAGLRLVLVTLGDLGASIDKTLGLRVARHDEAVAARCSGRVDPTCGDMASPHRAISGAVVSDLCSECFTLLCPTCRERPVAAPQRLVETSGRFVPGCEACYRSQRRMGAVA